MFSSSQVSLVALGLLGCFAPALAADDASSNCRYIPGDKGWPSASTWSKLNSTVGGRLIATVPLASVCHDPHYDAAACAKLKADWNEDQTHFPYSGEIMSPYWQNASCDPFTAQSKPCELGNYVSYAIAAKSASDVAAGLAFAEKNNVRLVVKNTGHDYNGKSTGKGALSIWTHNLDSVTFPNYKSKAYTGPAMKMGAGVEAFSAYTAADKQGLRVVGGTCATVGLAGGFTQGGGHSTMSSIYGMGADQTLEWEVVTANGTHLVATPTQNSDLYWALSGGGGGTYAVVISATVKAYKDGMVGGAHFVLNNTNPDTYWKAVEAFHTELPKIVDAGASVVYNLANDSFGAFPVTAPNKTKAEVATMLKPFLDKCKALGVKVDTEFTQYSGFLAHFNHYLGPLPYGLPLINPIDVSIAGRLIPRKVVESADTNKNLIDALKVSVKNGGGFRTGGVALNVQHGQNVSDNAVLPQWRSSILQLLLFAPWEFNGTNYQQKNLANNQYLLDATVPALAKVAPNGGAYLNEANFQQSDWKEAFYGANYPRLLSIKKAHDPTNLFFANSAVGSDVWKRDSAGRLCKA